MAGLTLNLERFAAQLATPFPEPTVGVVSAKVREHATKPTDLLHPGWGLGERELLGCRSTSEPC
jgi:hypothetical protein